jgi:hypothetical protein
MRMNLLVLDPVSALRMLQQLPGTSKANAKEAGYVQPITNTSTALLSSRLKQSIQKS